MSLQIKVIKGVMKIKGTRKAGESSECKWAEESDTAAFRAEDIRTVTAYDVVGKKGQRALRICLTDDNCVFIPIDDDDISTVDKFTDAWTEALQ